MNKESVTSEIVQRKDFVAALEAMLDECCNLCDVPNQMAESGHTCSWRNRWSGCRSKAIDKALAALSAPPRQCDVGTPEEQGARMAEFCRVQYEKSGVGPLCGGCRFNDMEGIDCQFAWAQMPYEENKNDN